MGPNARSRTPTEAVDTKEAPECSGPGFSFTILFSLPLLPSLFCVNSALCWQVAKECAINKLAACLHVDNLTDFLVLANLSQH